MKKHFSFEEFLCFWNNEVEKKLRRCSKEYGFYPKLWMTLFSKDKKIPMLEGFYHYLKNSEDHDYIKSVLIVMLLGYFIYESLFNVILISPHEESYEAFLRTPSLLVMLFVFGYIFTIPQKKEEQHE